MKNRFIELWDRIGAEGNPRREFIKLRKMYSQTGRFYHNFKHINNCLLELDSIRKSVPNLDLIEFAIWYHDVIYNTKAKNNEEKSAQLAYEVALNSSLSKKSAELIKEIILATKHEYTTKRIETKIMVDIDLSILGKPRQEFDEYERNIQGEYSWVPKSKFIDGRRAILKMFLDRERIYLTDFFRNKYEMGARKNLQRSISNLRKEN